MTELVTPTSGEQIATHYEHCGREAVLCDGTPTKAVNADEFRSPRLTDYSAMYRLVLQSGCPCGCNPTPQPIETRDPEAIRAHKAKGGRVEWFMDGEWVICRHSSHPPTASLHRLMPLEPDPDDGWSHGWLDQIPVGSRYRLYRDVGNESVKADHEYASTSVWFCPPPPEPETMDFPVPLPILRGWAMNPSGGPLSDAARAALDAAGLPREKP